MSTDFSPFRVGQTVFPITTSTADSTVSDCDPVMVEAVNYWKAIIDLEVTPRWNATVQKLINDQPKQSALLKQLSGSMIRSVVFEEPYPWMNEFENQFPLMAAYTLKEEFSWRTLGIPMIKASCCLDIILPPLSYEVHRRLMPLLRAAGRALWDRTEQGYDGNVDSGHIPWPESVSDIGFDVSYPVGSMKFAAPAGHMDTNLSHPVLHMTWHYTADKRLVMTSSLAALHGLDATINVVTSSNDASAFSGSFNVSGALG